MTTPPSPQTDHAAPLGTVSIGTPRKIKVGDRFGRLTAVVYLGSGRWDFVCDCGRNKTTKTQSIIKGYTRSCGCLRNEKSAERARIRNLTHGMTKSPEYGIWVGMRTRCERPSTNNYQDYGGRGIRVCERWRVFENFYSDMGPRPSPRHTLDRIDVDGNYEPGNVRWATWTEQSTNHRKMARLDQFTTLEIMTELRKRRATLDQIA